MDNLISINDSISRLTVPFSDVYTTVFIIKTEDGVILFDSATYASDVDNFIIPALCELGVTAEMLKYVFLSHEHGDHAGGLPRLLEIYPDVCIASRSKTLREKYKKYRFVCPDDGQLICGSFVAVAVPGHSADSMILFDTVSRTAITGDSLQLYGLFGSGEWGANIGMPAEHLEALKKLKKLEIECIFASHNYHPMGYEYRGRENVERAFSLCSEPLMGIAGLIRKNPGLTDSQIRELYHKSEKLPTVRLGVFEAVRRSVNEGKI